MARVFSEKKSNGRIRLFCFAVAIIAIIVGIWYIAGSLQTSQEREQIKIAQDAITRATVQCYSLEGRYPTGLQYLEDNYGITLNEEKYVYYYQSIGANIMPNIRVMTL